jgi:hypothetical protein
MKLSEQLEQDEACGDFGKALEGYSERAKALECKLWHYVFMDAVKWGASEQAARNHADKTIDEI